MRRSTALRLSIAALVLAPTMTACGTTITIPGGSATTAAAETTSPEPAPATTEAAPAKDTKSDSSRTEPTSSDDKTSDKTTDTTTDDKSSDATTDSTADTTSTDSAPAPAPASAPAKETGSKAGARQRISVPADSGITSLEAIALNGRPSESGNFAEFSGVYSITNSRPVTLRLRYQGFDASGKKVFDEDGTAYADQVGTHTIVTSDTFSLPKSAKIKTYHVELVRTSDNDYGTRVVRIDKPTLGTSSDSSNVPTLRGTMTVKPSTSKYSDSNRLSVMTEAACVLPNGSVIRGSDTESSNFAGQSSKIVNYEAKLYDARNVDLFKATCYASAS